MAENMIGKKNDFSSRRGIIEKFGILKNSAPCKRNHFLNSAQRHSIFQLFQLC